MTTNCNNQNNPVRADGMATNCNNQNPPVRANLCVRPNDDANGQTHSIDNGQTHRSAPTIGENNKMQPICHIHHLSFSYSSTPLLENINLTIPANKTTVIIGPNGCGKTTLLKLICG